MSHAASGLPGCSSALRLGSERSIRLSPGSHVGELFRWPLAERPICGSLGRPQQPFARLVARSRDEPRDGNQHGAVVRPQHEHRFVHEGSREELL